MPIKKIIEQPQLINQLIFESMSDGMWTVESNLLCSYINNAALNMLGYNRDQCIGKNMHQLIHYKYPNGDHYPESDCTICQTVLNKDHHVVDDEVFWKSDGTPLPVRYSSSPVIVNGELMGVLVLFSDISALKKKEAEIIRVKNNQENLINATEDFIWSIDTERRLTSFNRAYAERIAMTTGRPIEEGKLAIEKEFGIEIVTKWEAYYDRALGGESFKVTEQICDPVLNSVEYDLISFVPMYNAAKQVCGVACSGKDITEEVNRRISIADTYSDLENIFNQSMDVICTVNEDGRFIRMSAACENMWGYTPEELIGKVLFELLYPDDLEKTYLAGEELKQGKDITVFENRYIHKSGQIVAMLWSIKWNAKEKTLYCIGRDNSEKKRAEEQLAESLAFLKEAQRFAKMGSWKSDFKADKLTWSEELYHIFGANKDTFHETHGSFSDFIDDRDKQFVWDVINNTRKTGEPFNLQYRITTGNGERRVLESQGYGKKDSDGSVTELFGTTQDITDRKKTEAKLEEANQRFELATRATFDAIWDWNVMDNTFYWGAGFQMLFGYNIIGLQNDSSSWTDNIHPDDFKRVIDGIDALLDSEASTWLDEYRFRKQDGSYAYVQDKGIIIRDEQGQATRFVGALQDITRRKTEELRLKLLESVVTNTNDVVVITEAEPLNDPGPRIIYVNEAFTKMTGYTAEEVIGKSPRILQGPNSDRDELDRLALKLKNWESCELTIINYRKNGEEFWNNFTVSPVADEKGWFTHWIAIQRDITEAKKTEFQLRLLNKNLEKQANDLAISNAELEQFAFVASHDLQEPLRMITSFLTQLEKKYYDVIDERGKKYIYFAVDGAMRMRQIILDLLEYSRVGRLEVNAEEINLTLLIEDILALYKKKIEESSAIIKVRELPRIFADRVLLRQIFQNLIGNALKYQQVGTIPKITISCENTPGYWKFAVSDNGIGIDAEYFDQIFIIFKRLHTREAFSGTGMGLSITKKVVENLGGRIFVTSEKDKGSTFYFTIKK